MPTCNRSAVAMRGRNTHIDGSLVGHDPHDRRPPRLHTTLQMKRPIYVAVLVPACLRLASVGLFLCPCSLVCSLYRTPLSQGCLLCLSHVYVVAVASCVPIYLLAMSLYQVRPPVSGLVCPFR